MAIDINELKQMLKHSTAVLILDNGDPSFVVVNYHTYRNLLETGEPHAIENGPSLMPPRPAAPAGTSAADPELLERINKDILALKSQIEQEEKQLGIE